VRTPANHLPPYYFISSGAAFSDVPECIENCQQQQQLTTGNDGGVAASGEKKFCGSLCSSSVCFTIVYKIYTNLLPDSRLSFCESLLSESVPTQSPCSSPPSSSC